MPIRPVALEYPALVLLATPRQLLESEGDRMPRPPFSPRLQVQLGQPLAGQEVDDITRQHSQLPSVI